MTTDKLENALAFAATESHEGSPRVILLQAKTACRTLAKEVEQLQKTLEHEFNQRIAAAVEGSRWKAEALRLRTAARSVCDYLAAEPDCCPSLQLEMRIRELAMALATEDHGDE